MKARIRPMTQHTRQVVPAGTNLSRPNGHKSPKSEASVLVQVVPHWTTWHLCCAFRECDVRPFWGFASVSLARQGAHIRSVGLNLRFALDRAGVKVRGMTGRDWWYSELNSAISPMSQHACQVVHGGIDPPRLGRHGRLSPAW